MHTMGNASEDSQKSMKNLSTLMCRAAELLIMPYGRGVGCETGVPSTEISAYGTHKNKLGLHFVTENALIFNNGTVKTLKIQKKSPVYSEVPHQLLALILMQF